MVALVSFKLFELCIVIIIVDFTIIIWGFLPTSPFLMFMVPIGYCSELLRICTGHDKTELIEVPTESD